MKTILIPFLLFVSVNVGRAQQYPDSLKQVISAAVSDNIRFEALGLLSSYYATVYPDSGIYYGDKILELAKKNGDKYQEAWGLIHKGKSVLTQGDFTTSLQIAYKVLNISKQLKEHRLDMLGNSYAMIGEINAVNESPRQAAVNLFKSFDLQKQSGEYPDSYYGRYFSLAFTMMLLDKKDSALMFLKTGWELFDKAKNKRDVRPWIVSGNVSGFAGDTKKAIDYFRRGIALGKEYNSIFYVAAISNSIADFYFDLGQRDSCIQYLHQSLYLSQKYHFKVFEMASSGFLSFIYDSISSDSTLKYLKITTVAKNEILSNEKIKQFQSASFEEEKKETDLENAKTEYETRLTIYFIIGAAVTLLVIAVILYRNNRQKQKANILLGDQKKKIEETFNELKSTQSQLIHSEKMASLGELTAGIAHEIQNPLNFVNNFSELNKELLEELKVEIDLGNFTDVKLIANNAIENQKKILHHGKRAEGIVKGMLQHSRSGGAKEPTDINALADEYLRLAYHGLKAKDKSFDATLKTEFDESLNKINVVPQDLGRVILNLITNAFYALNEKKIKEGRAFEPVITVGTSKSGNNIFVSVKDNGNGIPQKVLDKIFQPFFTTKPTGLGTGLGLSISYDIVKAHGGDLKVETREKEGTKFIIQLPAV